MLPTRHRGEYTETVDATLTHKRGHPRIIVPSGEHIVDSRSGAESEPGENCHYRLTLNVPPGICLICRGTEQRWRLYDGHLSRKSSLTALDQDQHPAQERLPQHCFPCVLLGDTPLQEAAIILTPHRRSSNGLDTTLLITRCWQSTCRWMRYHCHRGANSPAGKGIPLQKPYESTEFIINMTVQDRYHSPISISRLNTKLLPACTHNHTVVSRWEHPPPNILAGHVQKLVTSFIRRLP